MCFVLFVALLLDPSYFDHCWAEPSEIFAIMVLAVFVNLLILYHYDIEHMYSWIMQIAHALPKTRLTGL